MLKRQFPFNHDHRRTLGVRIIYSPSGAGRKVAFLKLAGARRRRWLVLGEFAKYAFCGLKRKRRDFERSVLKYVSIKIPALTHSGRKSRVCVNQPDRLLPPNKKRALFAFLSVLQSTPTKNSRTAISGNFLPFAVRHQKLVVESPSLYSLERTRRRWLVLSEFAKYAFFWPDKEKSCF